MATITIELKSETERRLRTEAMAQGLTLEGYVGRMVETDGITDAAVRPLKDLDAIAEPVRLAVEASGITDEELNELVQETRQEIWLEKQAKSS